MSSPTNAPFSDDDPRRVSILRHARHSFVTAGYAATRIEPIAREASVSTATLYGYFESKDVLFAAVIQDASHEFSRQMEFVRSTDEGSARERLTRFMVAYAAFMGDSFVRSVFRLVMAERPRFRDTAMLFFERGRRDLGGPLMATFKDLEARGEMVVPKPSWAAGQLMGMIEHPVFFMPLVTGDEAQTRRSFEQIAEEAVDTIIARYGTANAGS